jgi:hypothetical protein
LVFRSIWQHQKRLAVKSNDAGIAVSFGDVLVRKTRLEGAPAQEVGVDGPDAFIVLTPACDLVREKIGRVLLLGGVIAPLDQRKWTYKSSGVKTPIIQLENLGRSSISWNLADVRMLPHGEIEALIAADGAYSTVLRLREARAIEIQQLLLANMGRVGLVTTMPFTFPVTVDVFTLDPEGKFKSLPLPATSRDGGVCITGRGVSDDKTRLVLTESSVDEILAAVAKIPSCCGCSLTLGGSCALEWTCAP